MYHPSGGFDGTCQDDAHRIADGGRRACERRHRWCAANDEFRQDQNANLNPNCIIRGAYATFALNVGLPKLALVTSPTYEP